MSDREIRPRTAQQAMIDFRGASVLVTFVNNTSRRLTVSINEEHGTVLVRVDEDDNEVWLQTYHRGRKR